MDVKEIRTIGVIGCGLMGAGIAEVCCMAGYTVLVREVNSGLLDRGLGAIRGSLTRAVEKGRMSQTDMEAARDRLNGALALEELAECDLVIEAAIEEMDLKKGIFKELDLICKPETILASNTSSLSITEIASVTRRPDKVLGLHFFNPVPVMPLLEVVTGLKTGPENLEMARALGQVLGKTVVIAKDRPGFLVNLLLIPFLLDAIRWLDSGLATKEDLDLAIKLGLNHPMGPIALSDLIGLDTVMFIADALYDEFKDPRYVAPTVLRRMVTAGYLGKKSGCGFYNYSR